MTITDADTAIGLASNTSSLCASPLHAVETAFLSLASGHAPLMFEAAHLGESAPAGRDRVTVAQLRTVLLASSTPFPVRDAVWAELIRRSHQSPGAWTVVAVAMAMPELMKLASTYGRGFDGAPEDLHAEILAAFLERLKVIDTAVGGIWPKLAWAARRAAIHAVETEIEYTRHAERFCSAPPRMPFGHEDLVLARAEREGVISAADADLIGMTRLEGVQLAEAAEMLGASKNAVKIRRQRAEARLVAWIAGRRVPSTTALAACRTRA
ncbi:hypothetical protein ABH926_004845 [Catenulispora sp. GP43]|uniref:hypothetical protein n=1 Tax=Catenulispora sp. GP43 TaxID=3156263 RepID=UPI0035140C29